MRHATPGTLDILEPLLERVRALGRLREPKRGAFYLRSSGFLHFHEDPAGLFADVKVGGSWQRLPATSEPDWDAVLAAVAAALPCENRGGRTRD